MTVDDTPADEATLTVERKAALTSGASFWTTESAPGLRPLTLTDGPHGVRAQRGAADHLGIAESEPATCFPPATGLGQSWDAPLVRRVGEALGREARALDVDVLLGPGLNIRRDPRCGRNFEYFSEDPTLTAQLGAAWVDGVQSQHVGTSPKHFAANNAETDRMRSSSDVDPRALREIYLRAFQQVVSRARPWTVMAAYNRVNGEHVGESRALLTRILREEWGFDGAVVSDWGAVTDRVAAIAAGLDLAMPGPGESGDREVVAATRDGRLAAETLDATAGRLLRLLDRVRDRPDVPELVDLDAHHDLAREAATRSLVLLQNDDDLLPLARTGRIAVIGRFAAEPRYQGGGSSHVNPTRVDVPLDEIRRNAPAADVPFAPGFPGSAAEESAALRREAVDLAGTADVAVVFVGLPESEESEGFDREHIELPACQIELLRAVAEVQPATVVVLSHGGVVALGEVTTCARAILDGALLGQGGGAAVADVLFGTATPSGRLTETVPLRLEDVPSFLTFPGEHSHVLYGESVFVGYRWYDARRMDVAYPFGHGLSYTTFRYDDLAVESSSDEIVVTLRVTNEGRRDGREVVQLYVGLPHSAVQRPPRELKAFATVDIPAGGARDVRLRVPRADLAYWDRRVDRWVVEGGTYELSVGASSRDIRVTGSVPVAGDELRLPLTASSTIAEVMADPSGRVALSRLMPERPEGSASDVLGMDVDRMTASMPLAQVLGFAGGGPEAVQAFLAQLED